MGHLVLARKYRPQSFSEVIGQDLIVSTLSSALAQGRIAHAMLFTGGRGIGKTTIARLVAKAIVCEERVGIEPCKTCSQCVAIDNFSSLDVVEIDGASHTGVDDIRELRESARYQPSSAKRKIFIIDEVHMLSINAFNALLKILEEPPPHVMFIFATTESHKIPKTILSRCQRYDFRRVSHETIFLALKNIMKLEGFVVEDAGLHLLASLADGSLRDALSMAEQIVSNEMSSYSEAFISAHLGVVSHQAVKDIAQALIDQQVDQALLLAKEVYEHGFDLCHLMDALVERFRVLSLCAHLSKERAFQVVQGLDEADFDRASQHDKMDLKRMFAMALDHLSQVFASERPLFMVELFLLKAALRPPLGDAVTINHCLQKLDALMHNRPLPVEAPKPMSRPMPPTLAASPMEKKSPERDIVEIFSSLLLDISVALPALASHLRHARPLLDLSADRLSLGFELSLHFEQVQAYEQHPGFKSAIKRAFGRNLELKLTLKAENPKVLVKTVAEAEAEKIKQEQASLYEEAQNHPLMKKALAIFGGDITDVRKIEPENDSPFEKGA